MEVINTKQAPAAIGPYSQGIIVNGFLFASGQIPLNPQTGEMVGDTIAEQTVQVMKNIEGLLEAAGLTFNNVVKSTCYLTDISQFGIFNDVYARYCGDVFPARSAVEVANLPKGALVEVEVIAAMA